jgi:hypothetical protein
MIIGISGKIGSGKDTLSIVINYLADKSAPDSFNRWEQPLEEYTFKNKKYAENLKCMVCFLIGCNRIDLEDREFKEKELGEEWDGLTPRKILQLLGTEAGREIIHPNIWVNSLFADYPKIVDIDDKGLDVYESWIITDVRFPNEAQAIKDRGGIVIRIERPGGESHCGGAHASETALDDYDFDIVINNDGTIEELIDKVKQLNLV